MHAVFVKVCGLEGTAVSVGAGLGTGILEGNPPSFYAPSTDSFFGEGGCVAPAVRSGTGRHTFRRRPNGVVSIFSRRFFELARSIFTRSGGTFSSTFFRSFRPLSHARFARFVVRETHTDAHPRQALFFSHRRRGGSERIDSHYGSLQKKEWRARRGPVSRTLLPVDPEPRASSSSGGFTRDCASKAAHSCQHGVVRIASSSFASRE